MARMWEPERTDMTQGEVEKILQHAKWSGLPIRWSSWKETRTTGGMRPATLVSFAPKEVSEDEFDRFSDLRIKLGGWARKQQRSRIVQVEDSGWQWGSFRIVLALPEGYPRENSTFSRGEEPQVHEEFLAFLDDMSIVISEDFAPKRIKIESVFHARGEIYEIFWRHHRVVRIVPRGRTAEGRLRIQVDADWRELPLSMLKQEGLSGQLRTDDPNEAADYVLALLDILVSIEGA